LPTPSLQSYGEYSNEPPVRYRTAGSTHSATADLDLEAGWVDPYNGCAYPTRGIVAAGDIHEDILLDGAARIRRKIEFDDHSSRGQVMWYGQRLPGRDWNETAVIEVREC
jgi:hypothetical protein